MRLSLAVLLAAVHLYFSKYLENFPGEKSFHVSASSRINCSHLGDEILRCYSPISRDAIRNRRVEGESRLPLGPIDFSAHSVGAMDAQGKWKAGGEWFLVTGSLVSFLDNGWILCEVDKQIFKRSRKRGAILLLQEIGCTVISDFACKKRALTRCCF